MARGGDVTFLYASQFQFAAQGQFGDAVADDGVARVSRDQWITQNQANAGEIENLNQGADFVGDIFN